MAPRRVILQPGTNNPSDLFVYAHIDPSIIKQRVAEVTQDCAVVEFWGEGTGVYKQVLPAFGGSWATYKRSLEMKLGKALRKSTLTTWSAGSQLAKDVCAAGGELPDAIVMMDGLYGNKPAGSKAGDGQVVMDAGLKALAEYAIAAACGKCVFVLFHSKIPTPYASSKECAEAIRKHVEDTAMAKMTPDDSLTAADLDGHAFDSALVLGNFHLVEFPGMDGKEHVTEAHLYDEAWKRWVPWVGSDDPTPEPAPAARSVGELALELSLGEEAARVGETPPGSNKVKPAYWAGCMRTVGGKEVLLKLTVGPWCAAAFQWASYEAARQMGLPQAATADWRVGPVPHGRRVSVLELQNDFKARGAFLAKADFLGGKLGRQVEPGDAVFLDRGGANPGQEVGHVCRFVRAIDAFTFETVGGNESGDGRDRDDAGDRWRRTVRRYDDQRLRGFGLFPRPHEGAPGAPQSAMPELAGEVAAELDKTMRDWLARARPDLDEPKP